MTATRILGIDYGTKRIGVALSDENADFGQPYCVIKNSKTALEEIAEIAKKENVLEIVLGESKDFKGNDNAVMPEIRDFKSKLESATGLPVNFELEFLTSHQAEHFQGKHELLDASAAAIILQSYLDKKKNRGTNEKSEKNKIENKMDTKTDITEKKDTAAEVKTYITIDDFSKVEIRAGRILKAEAIAESSKLLKLEVDFGEEKPRQVLSGIAKYFPDPIVLVEKTVGFVANLQPRLILGLESQAMILAVSTDSAFSLLSIDPSIAPGTKIK